jgi:hypothetical protein
LGIETAVKQSVSLIPIVTPRAINTSYCQFEFAAFLTRERALGRTDLVFPILYIAVPALNEAGWRNNPDRSQRSVCSSSPSVSSGHHVNALPLWRFLIAPNRSIDLNVRAWSNPLSFGGGEALGAPSWVLTKQKDQQGIPAYSLSLQFDADSSG